MVLTIEEQIDILKIFALCKFDTKVSKPCVALMEHWEKHKGIDFVVGKLKDYRSFLLGRSNSKPKGPFAPVVNKGLRSRKDLVLADRALRVYQRWYADPSVEHFKKLEAVITQTEGEAFKVEVPKSAKNLAAKFHADFDLFYPVSPNKKVPGTGSPEREVFPEQHKQIFHNSCPKLVKAHKAFLDLMHPSSFWSFYDLEDLLFQTGEPFSSKEVDFNETVGKISLLTADRGRKVRFVANPNRFAQMALSRLKSKANWYLQKMPESYVHDQISGHALVQSWLKSGSKVWSLDLSSATDHFPLSLQIGILRQLFPDLNADIDFFQDVSRCSWDTPIGKLRWTKGQPMGLAPSFAVFTLSHVHLVRSLGGNASNFAVIGDDIVIRDEILADAYSRVCTKIGVSISSSKSLYGSRYAEFAGRIIDSNGILPSFKSTPVDAYKDPMGPIRQYGVRGAELLPDFMRQTMIFFAGLPTFGTLAVATETSLLTHQDIIDLYSTCPLTIEAPSLINRGTSCFANPLTNFEEKQTQLQSVFQIRSTNIHPVDRLLTNAFLALKAEDPNAQPKLKAVKAVLNSVWDKEVYSKNTKLTLPWRFYKNFVSKRPHLSHLYTNHV